MTFNYDTRLRHLSVGFWGVIDCPLKCEVREQFDGQNTLPIWRVSGRKPEKSCTTNTKQYISTSRWAFPCSRQIETSMVVDQYTSDPCQYWSKDVATKDTIWIHTYMERQGVATKTYIVDLRHYQYIATTNIKWIYVTIKLISWQLGYQKWQVMESQGLQFLSWMT